MMRISCFGCLAEMLFACYTFHKQTDVTLISANISTLGIVLVPMIPIGINFSSELTFPIEPTVVTGTLMMTGQLGGFLLAIAAGTVISKFGSSYAWILFSLLAFVASFCSLIIHEDLRKTNYTSKKIQVTADGRDKELALYEDEESMGSETQTYEDSEGEGND